MAEQFSNRKLIQKTKIYIISIVLYIQIMKRGLYTYILHNKKAQFQYLLFYI